MQTWRKTLAVFLSLMMVIAAVPLRAYALENTSDESMPESAEVSVKDAAKTGDRSDNLDYEETPAGQDPVEVPSEVTEDPVNQETNDGQEESTNNEPSENPGEQNNSIISDESDATNNQEQSGEQENLREMSKWANLLNDGNIEEYRAQKEQLLVQRRGTAALADDDVDSSYPYGPKMIGNTYIEASIDESGAFTIGTREGDPSSDTDNYQNLLFGHPYPGTSETLIRINGEDYLFAYYTTNVVTDGNECVATAVIEDVEIRQILSLQTNPYTNIEDVVSIQYQYKNNSGSTKQIGIRIMMDTMLGDNDGSPFRVNGRDVTLEMEYAGDSVPQYWQSFYSLSDPKVVSTGFFYFDAAERPDKVQFASWPRIAGSSWNYQISASTLVTYDSAVAAYFNPRTVANGGSGSVVTYYGVSGFSDENTDLREPLAVRVTAPPKLYGGQGIGGYLNNPFNLSIYMDNISGRVLKDVTVVLDLSKTSDKLSFISGQNESIPIGDMNVGESQTVQCNLQAVPQRVASTVPYSILFYSGDEELKSMNMRLSLDALNEDNMYCTVSFDLNGQAGIPPEEQRVSFNGTVTKPEDPVSENAEYVFDGWYKDSDGTIPWNFTQDRVTVNMRLYAKWVKQDVDLGFKITGIAEMEDDSNLYILDSLDDTYYEENVRTVLVSGNVDLKSVKLEFEVDPRATIKVEDLIQTSGETEVDFTDSVRQAIKYTVETPSGQLTRDYWVTVIKEQDAENLFVNATNIRVDGNYRTLLLLGPDYYHDIFLANTGTEPLSNLTITLDAEHVTLAQNSARTNSRLLMEGNNGSLPGFSEGEEEPQNYAKVRLYPDGKGEVKGTLTISADGQEDVVIQLTGVAGEPFTEIKVPNAVKYVPYEANLSKLIGDFDFYDRVEFSSNTLPDWLKLEDGVLSGVPLSTGTLAIALNVTLRLNNQEITIPTTFSLTVDNNSDTNVTDKIDPGYEIIQRVPNMETVQSNQIFSTYGPFHEFIALYLDGLLLQENMDYEARAGSTVITVYEKTFQPLSNGTHTLAATFQSDSGVKRVAQNFYIGKQTQSNNTGGGSSSSSSERSTSTTKTPNSYSINIPRFEHGTILSSSGSAVAGTKVTLTSRPDSGYQLEFLKVKGSTGKEVTLTETEDGRYTFTMPNGNVNVSAAFVKILSELGMDDVYPNSWFYEAVKWALENGVTKGVDSDSFAPNLPCTRAQIMTFLWRSSGSPEPDTMINPFLDVSADAYYYKAVLWAIEQGITTGTTASTFSPDDGCIRAQAVTFLYRANGSPDVPVDSRFSDVDSGAYYGNAVAWAVANEITNGTTADTFSPNSTCTRAQIVTFLWRDMID